MNILCFCDLLGFQDNTIFFSGYYSDTEVKVPHMMTNSMVLLRGVLVAMALMLTRGGPVFSDVSTINLVFVLVSSTSSSSPPTPSTSAATLPHSSSSSFSSSAAVLISCSLAAASAFASAADYSC